jgi:hypothetical protein
MDEIGGHAEYLAFLVRKTERDRILDAAFKEKHLQITK